LACGPERAERLRARAHRRPRAFGKPGGLWTPGWAAGVGVAAGIVPTRVSGETIRQTPLRLGVSRGRAKRRITSPDPAYGRKKGGVTA